MRRAKYEGARRFARLSGQKPQRIEAGKTYRALSVVVRRPLELQLELLVAARDFVFNGEVGAGGHGEAGTGDLDPEALARLHGVGDAAELGGESSSGNVALDVTVGHGTGGWVNGGMGEREGSDPWMQGPVPLPWGNVACGRNRSDCDWLKEEPAEGSTA